MTAFPCRYVARLVLITGVVALPLALEAGSAAYIEGDLAYGPGPESEARLLTHPDGRMALFLLQGSRLRMLASWDRGLAFGPKLQPLPDDPIVLPDRSSSPRLGQPAMLSYSAEGPFGETLYVVAPTVHGTLFVRSDDMGITWSEPFALFDSALPYRDLGIASANELIVTAGDRMRASHDGGRSWSPEREAPGTDTVIDDRGVSWSARACESGICVFRSETDGETWSPLESPVLGHGLDMPVWDLEAAPGGGTLLPTVQCELALSQYQCRGTLRIFRVESGSDGPDRVYSEELPQLPLSPRGSSLRVFRQAGSDFLLVAWRRGINVYGDGMHVLSSADGGRSFSSEFDDTPYDTFWSTYQVTRHPRGAWLLHSSSFSCVPHSSCFVYRFVYETADAVLPVELLAGQDYFGFRGGFAADGEGLIAYWSQHPVQVDPRHMVWHPRPADPARQAVTVTDGADRAYVFFVAREGKGQPRRFVRMASASGPLWSPGAVAPPVAADGPIAAAASTAGDLLVVREATDRLFLSRSRDFGMSWSQETLAYSTDGIVMPRSTSVTGAGSKGFVLGWIERSPDGSAGPRIARVGPGGPWIMVQGNRSRRASGEPIGFSGDVHPARNLRLCRAGRSIVLAAERSTAYGPVELVGMHSDNGGRSFSEPVVLGQPIRDGVFEVACSATGDAAVLFQNADAVQAAVFGQLGWRSGVEVASPQRPWRSAAVAFDGPALVVQNGQCAYRLEAGGSTFEPGGCGSNWMFPGLWSTSSALAPTAAGDLLAVWTDYYFYVHGQRLFVSRSMDGGRSWDGEVAGDGVPDGNRPSLVVLGERAFIVFSSASHRGDHLEAVELE